MVVVGLGAVGLMAVMAAARIPGTCVRLLGSYLGDSVPARDIPLYLQMWRDGTLPVERLHTDTKPIAELNEGLDALADGAVERRLFAFA